MIEKDTASKLFTLLQKMLVILTKNEGHTWDASIDSLIQMSEYLSSECDKSIAEQFLNNSCISANSYSGTELADSMLFSEEAKSALAEFERLLRILNDAYELSRFVGEDLMDNTLIHELNSDHAGLILNVITNQNNKYIDITSETGIEKRDISEVKINKDIGSGTRYYGHFAGYDEKAALISIVALRNIGDIRFIRYMRATKSLYLGSKRGRLLNYLIKNNCARPLVIGISRDSNRGIKSLLLNNGFHKCSSEEIEIVTEDISKLSKPDIFGKELLIGGEVPKLVYSET